MARLSKAELRAARREGPWLSRIMYGNGVERIVATEAEALGIAEHLGGPNRADFRAAERLFDVTTEKAIPAHLRRAYGPRLNILPYHTPPGWYKF
jgi:hypothetical protein